jgi:hypothetical protein
MRTLLVVIVASVVGCDRGPTTLFECSMAAATAPTEVGVKFAVRTCRNKFKPEYEAEKKAENKFADMIPIPSQGH